MTIRTHDVSDDVIAARKRTGAHRWDERWDGVWHLMPSPTRRHQDICAALVIALRSLCGHPTRSHVHMQLNVARPGRWPNDYREADVVLLKPGRFSIDKDVYLEGGPNLVVEVRSPNDECEAKIRFYDDIGVDEVWILDSITLDLTIFARRDLGAPSSPTTANAEGWQFSATTGVEFRRERSRSGDETALGIRHRDRPENALRIP